MLLTDFLRLFHPAIAVIFVFPLIGMVVNFAWQTRQRRLQVVDGEKSKIPPAVGPEHVKMGRWLTGAVVGIALLGLTHPIFKTILQQNVWAKAPSQVVFIVLMYVVTIASLVLLYRSQTRLWRGIFATFTGMGLVVLGCQEGVFRRGYEWYMSHYYIGMVAAMLMVFSLAILPDIYKDRSNTWRSVHVALNCIALLLFIGQGMTGMRDLLDIAPSWQEPHISRCDFVKLTCPAPPQSSLPNLDPALKETNPVGRVEAIAGKLKP